MFDNVFQYPLYQSLGSNVVSHPSSLPMYTAMGEGPQPLKIETGVPSVPLPCQYTSRRGSHPNVPVHSHLSQSGTHYHQQSGK